MRRLFTFADRYYRQRDWKMLVPLKFCLLAAGCLLGLSVKKERKRPVALVAMALFVSTYVPLMIDMLQALPTLWPREKAPEEAEEAEAPDTEEEAPAPADAPAEAAQETPEGEPAQVSEETVAEEAEAPEAPAEEPAQPAEEAPQEAAQEAEAPAEPAEETDEEETSAPI